MMPESRCCATPWTGSVLARRARPDMPADAQQPAPRHTPAEDVYAILIGSSFSAFGVVMLHMAGLVTGGVAGLALIGSYLSGYSVGALFFVLNLPFLVLGQR